MGEVRDTIAEYVESGVGIDKRFLLGDLCLSYILRLEAILPHCLLSTRLLTALNRLHKGEITTIPQDLKSIGVAIE